MTKGSRFFERMSGGWRYNITCRPKWSAPLAERIGVLVLQRDIDRRILGFARGCEDPVVLAHVAAQRTAWTAREHLHPSMELPQVHPEAGRRRAR